MPEPTHDELEAGPAAGARIGRIDIPESALDVMGGRAGQGLIAHASAAQREQAQPDGRGREGGSEAGAHEPGVYRRLP